MAKPKRFKIAKLTKPSWVGNVDISKCENGLVYQIYQCRKCIIEFKEDQARPNRKKYLLLPGSKKRQMVEVCECEQRTPLLIKYKKCKCGAEFWGFFLRENPTCRLCSKFIEKPKEIDEGSIKYYRVGEFYKRTDKDLSDPERWDCLNRLLCLEISRHRGANKGIACLDCPFYKKGEF